MRKPLATVLFALTGACLLLAGVIAATELGSYMDSKDSYYLGTAALLFGIGLVCLAAGVWALRSRDS